MRRRSSIVSLSVLAVTVTLGTSRSSRADLPARILAPDGTPEDRFGYSVALSGDTAIISAPGDAPQGSQSGAAYVFVQTAGNWSLQAKLTASDGVANASFGQQVALSGDIAVVGAPYAVVGGTVTGAAYIYARSGTTWTQQAKLAAADPHPFDYFGSTVSISGTTVVVGAPYSDVFGSDSGAAYVFVASGATWTQQAKIWPTEGRSDDLFASSVAISQNTLLAGAPNDDDDAIASGSVYVYFRSGTTWSLQQKLRPADRANGDLFGTAVALETDTAIIGAPDRDDRGLASGAAYIYLRSGGTWTQQQKLLAVDGAPGDFFGAAVTASPDGVLVGAFLDDEGAVDTGSAYAFERVAGVFVLRDKLLAPDRAAGDNFGVSVSISGNRTMIGSEQSDARGSNAGAAYGATLFGRPVPAAGPMFLALLGILLVGVGAARFTPPRRRPRLSHFRRKTVGET